jgi:steroid 5-alpha reductase family enzyme
MLLTYDAISLFFFRLAHIFIYFETKNTQRKKMLMPLVLSRMRETALVVGTANAVGFVATTATETHKLTDLVGVGSFVLATVHLAKNNPLVMQTLSEKLTVTSLLQNRVLLINGLVCLWGTRLAGYLFRRINYTGEDKRLNKFYREKGEKWFDSSRSNYPFGLGFFWSIQALWGWIGTLPVTLLNSAVSMPLPTNPILSWLPIAGMVTGFVLETVADYQKYCFKSEPKNAEKWCNVGLWSVSRYPNCKSNQPSLCFLVFHSFSLSQS